MNEDMKRVLEELEKDLLEEEIVEEAPQNSAFDDDLLIDMPQSITQSTTAEEDIDAILADFLAEGEEDTEAVEVEAAPAFEDPDKPDFPEEPVTYCNYSNDYGNDGEEMKKKSKAAKEDKWQIILMGIACGLCVAIIGVMIYWLEAFLR